MAPPTKQDRSSKRWILLVLVTLLLAASCIPGFDAPSKVDSLRIIAVTLDKPYAQPGDDVTFSMTVVDTGENDDGNPRPLQVLWLGGCYNPTGDQYFLCFEQLFDQLSMLEGTDPADFPPGLLQLDTVLPTTSGAPDALSFTVTLPDDLISSRPVPQNGPHYGIGYVFFAACAGTIAPAPLTSTGGDVPDFPLTCLDESGNERGADSFVIGYTQVYAFADGRENQNPPLLGIQFKLGTENDNPYVDLPESAADAPVVPACRITEEERRVAGCGAEDPEEVCTPIELIGLVPPFGAEVDGNEVDEVGNPLTEVVWLNYFSDGGTFDPSLTLVNDATTGLQDDFQTLWIPPSIPGVYTIWVTVRDQRGGQSVLRRYIRVE